MGNSFFVEKPELYEISKGSNRKQQQNIDIIEYNALYYVFEGSIQVLINEQIVSVFEGQALLIYGTDIHKQLRPDCIGYYRVLLSDIIPYQETDDNKQSYRIFELAQEQQTCVALCEKMLSEVSTENPSKEIMDSFLESLLSIMWKFLTLADGCQTGFVTIAKTFIEKHYKENITLSEIAEYVNVSVYHLSHTFKEEIGISPIQYAIQCRMDYAKKQLVESNISIHRIALELGYDNPNYFNLLFKKTIGLSPGKYRKIFR